MSKEEIKEGDRVMAMWYDDPTWYVGFVKKGKDLRDNNVRNAVRGVRELYVEIPGLVAILRLSDNVKKIGLTVWDGVKSWAMPDGTSPMATLMSKLTQGPDWVPPKGAKLYRSVLLTKTFNPKTKIMTVETKFIPDEEWKKEFGEMKWE